MMHRFALWHLNRTDEMCVREFWFHVRITIKVHGLKSMTLTSENIVMIMMILKDMDDSRY